MSADGDIVRAALPLHGEPRAALARLEAAAAERDRLNEEADALREQLYTDEAMREGRYRAQAQRDALAEALRGCIQYGVDGDGNAWVAVDPAGIDEAARLLGITRASILAEAGLE